MCNAAALYVFLNKGNGKPARLKGEPCATSLAAC
jgi:hypothetical protein